MRALEGGDGGARLRTEDAVGDLRAADDPPTAAVAEGDQLALQGFDGVARVPGAQQRDAGERKAPGRVLRRRVLRPAAPDQIPEARGNGFVAAALPTAVAQASSL